MTRYKLQKNLLLLFLVVLSVRCTVATSPTTDAPFEDSPSPMREEVGPSLPLLPTLREEEIGGSLPHSEHDPFRQAAFALAIPLPQGAETAVVEQHSFASLDEARARKLANQFGFTGPLYIQQIAPEYAPPAGSTEPPMFSLFEGKRFMNITNFGVTYQDGAVSYDFAHPLPFSEAAPLVEAQLKEWHLLDFPYDLRQLPGGELVIYPIVNGLVSEQSEFSVTVGKGGEVGFLYYRPWREIKSLGNYPLISAETAFQQMQTHENRSFVRYQLSLSPPDDPYANFVNPRSWGINFDTGQEVHLYMTPAVFEATDGSGLRVMHGDMTLTGDKNDLAEIATHLANGLHVWGTVNEVEGTKTLAISGWEITEIVEYETFEGTIRQQSDGAMLQTVDGDTFILAAAPSDLPDGIEVYVTSSARRDAGANYLLLDWNSISEKIDFPELSSEIPNEAPTAITEVTINSAELIYFNLYQLVDGPGEDFNFIILPTWKFEGVTDQGQLATFWVPAVASEFLQSTHLPTHSDIPAANASISGWVWHDKCKTEMDGEPALTTTPDGCVDSASPLGPYRGNGTFDVQNEPSIPGLLVALGEGACPARGVAEYITIAGDHSYAFTGLEAGTYCVSINPSEEPNMSLLRPGIWTFPEVAQGIIGKTVTLKAGQNIFDVNFGWDYQFLP